MKQPISIDEQLEIRAILYFCFGLAVIVCNTIDLIVFLSCREFRMRFLLYTFLTVAELSNGISLVMTGIGRERLIRMGLMNVPTLSTECMFEKPWTIALFIGGTLPATANLSLSLERLFAVRFAWYYRKWNNRQKPVIVIVSIVICLLLLLLVFLSSTLFPFRNENGMCAVFNSVERYTATFHYFLISLLYFVSFIVVVYVSRLASTHKKMSKSESIQQKISMSIIGISVVCVAIPNYVLIVDGWRIVEVPEIVVGATYCLYGLQSCSTMIVFVLFRPEFRRRLQNLICFGMRYQMSSMIEVSHVSVPTDIQNRQTRSIRTLNSFK